MPFTVKKITRVDTSSLKELGDSVVNLSKYTEDEFGQVARALQSTEAPKIWNSAPPKPRRGTIAFADGTHWNPGHGEGTYVFCSDNAWHFLGGLST